MNNFRFLSESLVHSGYVIDLVTGTFQAPDGTTFQRDIVRHPGAVSVVPLHEDGHVTMIRQYRASIDNYLLELPAGKRDVVGEAPELTASRELAEEVGLKAGSLELLGSFVNSPGFSDELSWVYLGRILTEVPRDVQGIEEENLLIERIHIDEVPAMIADGRLIDGKSIIGLLLARQRVGGG